MGERPTLATVYRHRGSKVTNRSAAVHRWEIYVYLQRRRKKGVRSLICVCVCWRPRLNASIELISPFLLPAGWFFIWYTVTNIEYSSSIYNIATSIATLGWLEISFDGDAGNMKCITFRSWAFFFLSLLFVVGHLKSFKWKSRTRRRF
jgi:hypothetical protein